MSKPKKASRAARAAQISSGAVGAVAIGASVVAATNAARRQGSSMADAAITDGLDTAKSYAIYGGAAAAGTYALVRAGMTAARAAPIVSAGMMAYGAVEGAIEAHKDGESILKGAAKGAWEYSLPGMLYDAVTEARDAAKDYKKAGDEERARFDEANRAWQQGKTPMRPPAGPDTYTRTRRDPRSGKMIRETVRKPLPGGGPDDRDIGIDPRRKSEDEDD